MITRKQYMDNSEELHHEYYLQFATQSSYDFINREIGLEKLLSSKDKYLNDLYKHSYGGNGTWIWDFTPFNKSLLKELGESNTRSTATCIGKAVAREILKQNKTN